MLAKNEFISLLQNPTSVGAEDVNSISSVIDSYPYFLTARLLKVRGLKNINAIGYESYLRKTASYTPNRETLYHLLMQEQLKTNIKQSEEVLEPTKEIVIEVESITEEIVESKEIQLIEKTEETKEVSELEHLILKEAVNASLAYELDPELLPTNTIKKETEPHNTEEIESKPVDVKQATTFSSWLKTVNDSPSTSVPKEIQDSSIEILIDQFIQTEPRIKPTKKEFFTPENMGRLSLVEDPDFVTETLAKIYAQQGDFERAISAFKKLSLKYPEKRTYFASLVKNIEKQLKQK
jgi:hypothetical protein